MLYSTALLDQLTSHASSSDDFGIMEQRLIDTVFEIESDSKSTKVPHNVVIGRITSLAKHPDADKLWVCQIDCGAHGTYQIITGGTNVVADTLVPVALPGCYLPMINLKIEPRRMRGMESCGMICSKGELGIAEDEDQHWIWLLDADITDQDLSINDKDILIGLPLVQLRPRLERTVFEVENVAITNRPDLNSHRGLAVERNALQGHPPLDTQSLEQFFPTTLPTENNPINNKIFEVQLSDTQVRYYNLVAYKGITMTQSNLRTRVALMDMGVMPRNTCIDMTNLSMMMTGQPLHVLDADRIVGVICVRSAKTDEKCVDLTGKEHLLQEGDIVIADDEKILAIAGIIGCQCAAVSDQTTHILVEIANFDPISIRKTSKRLGLRTDAVVRFEKDINPAWSQMISHMLQHHEIIPTQSQILTLSLEQVHCKIRGSSAKRYDNDIQQILIRLGYQITSYDIKTITVVSPLRRSDLRILEDIVEDIARHIGYNTITPIALPTTMQYHPLDTIVVARRRVTQLLVDRHQMTQCETYPRYHDEHLVQYQISKDHLIQLQNPSTTSQSYLRNHLRPQLIDIIVQNHKTMDTIGIFDIGQVYFRNDTLEGFADEKYDANEETRIAIALYQTTSPRPLESGFLKIQTIISELISKERSGGHINESYAYPHQGMTIHSGTSIVETVLSPEVIFRIHPTVLEKLGLPQDHELVIAEITLASTIKTVSSSHYETLSRHKVTRDVCFVLPMEMEYRKITSIINHEIEESDQISQYKILDVYQIDEHTKSITCSFEINSDDTLTSEDILHIIDQITQKVTALVGVSVR